MSEATTASRKQVASWFKPGVGGNPNGRPKGQPNKINRSIKEMILTALHDVGGAEYLARQAEANPVAFMGLVGRVLPLQLANEGGGALKVEFRWADEAQTPVIDATAEVVADETASVADGSDEPQFVFAGESE